MSAGVKRIGPARISRALSFLLPTPPYSERQFALVRARMPMKLGTKMVEAKMVATIAKYIRSPVARATGQAGIAALYDFC